MRSSLALLTSLLVACTPPDDTSTKPDETGAPATVITKLDVPYTPPSGGDAALSTLDITYLPDGQPKRLVLLVHGGSWVSGDKENFRTAAPELGGWWLDRGYVTAAVNFRLATTPPGPLNVGPVEQAHDIAHALAWLDDHAADYGITEDGAVAFGFSSGAHLVALLGADGSYLEAAGLPEPHIAATVSMDVHAYDVPYALELMEGSVVEKNIPLIEHLFGSTEAEQLVASPIRYIAGAVAPAMLVSAEPSPDEVGSHGYLTAMASEHYVSALVDEGQVAITQHWSDETHSSLVLDFGSDGDEPSAAVDAFLADVLPPSD